MFFQHPKIQEVLHVVDDVDEIVLYVDESITKKMTTMHRVFVR